MLETCLAGRFAVHKTDCSPTNTRQRLRDKHGAVFAVKQFLLLFCFLFHAGRVAFVVVNAYSQPMERRSVLVKRKVEASMGGAVDVSSELEVISPRAPEWCPVTAYLASVAPSSRVRLGISLSQVAAILLGRDDRIEPRLIPWERVGYAHAQALRQELSVRMGLSAANVCLSAFRGVLKASVALGYGTKHTHAALTVRGVKGHVAKKGRSLSAQEVGAMLAACAEFSPVLEVRNRAFIACLYYLGARIFEVCSIRVEDLGKNLEGVLLRGKGNKQRVVPIAKALRGYLHEYLVARGLHEGPLFLTADTKTRLHAQQPMDTRSGRHAFDRAAKAAGIEGVKPHDLRRTFISELLARGVDLARVQRLVGHSDPQTTAAYDRREWESAGAAVDLLPVLEETERHDDE